MKGLILYSILAFFSLTISVNQSLAQEATTKAEDKKEVTVYITDTGSKYHKSGCQYLSKSKNSTTLSKAKSEGFTACSKCYGGTPSTTKTTTTSGRCAATTKAGTQCKRNASAGSRYCWQHP